MREVGFEAGAEGEGAEWEGGVGEEEKEVGGGCWVVYWGVVSWGLLEVDGRERRETIIRGGWLGWDGE